MPTAVMTAVGMDGLWPMAYGLWGEKTGLSLGLRQPCFLFVTVSLETTYMARILSMALDVRSSSVGSGGIISAVMVLS